jgi:Na+/H+-dicarboxylate symporter
LGTIAIMLVTSKGAEVVSGSGFVVLAATATAIGVLSFENMAISAENGVML